MRNKKIFLILAIVSFQTNFVSAEIFKWVDSEGVTHYSEKKPADKVVSSIEIPAPPSDEVIQEAQNKYKRLIERQREEERVRGIRKEKVMNKCNLIRSQLTQLGLPGPFSFPVGGGGVIVVAGKGKPEFVKILKKDLKKNGCEDIK